jgi:bifunctional DNA-binding transcriptional regulator/antitoxin component of YhaV-PrlF toxin-antitoxin module
MLILHTLGGITVPKNARRAIELKVTAIILGQMTLPISIRQTP